MKKDIEQYQLGYYDIYNQPEKLNCWEIVLCVIGILIELFFLVVTLRFVWLITWDLINNKI